MNDVIRDGVNQIQLLLALVILNVGCPQTRDYHGNNFQVFIISCMMQYISVISERSAYSLRAMEKLLGHPVGLLHPFTCLLINALINIYHRVADMQCVQEH